MPKTTEPTAISESETTAKLTDEEVKAKREALIAELEALPTIKVEGLAPGTKIGDGFQSDYIPYTSEYYQKNFTLKEVFPSKSEVIRVNGVGFELIAGRKCFLPEPHYNVWEDSQRRAASNAAEFNPPENPSKQPGYLSPPHRMGPGPLIPHDDK